MSRPDAIRIQDYAYPLPEERIAKHPLAQRDASKLLVYRKGTISHHSFRDLPDLLPAESFLFFNDTKVIPARLLFQKETGAIIEVFLLHPHDVSVISQAMEARGHSVWQCTIGNAKRWTKPRLTAAVGSHWLEAEWLDKERGLVAFRWPAEVTFAEMVAQAGHVPLPPYLKRTPVPEDATRYQTVYSKHAGAVAAPTAGLHFTDAVLENLQKKGFGLDYLTLHVSAGTFLPVKAANALEHAMHAEQMVISRSNLENLIGLPTIVAVGTTSARTLESLYWYGVALATDPEAAFVVRQDDPYQLPGELTVPEAMRHVLHKLDREGTEWLVGETSIYLVPGYRYRVVGALITNFHQPASTLMLLVAALIGEDWRAVYAEALERGYRFLSYGDSSLLIP
ncbi:MAG: S-adenosylmethionine:tRNA ribosyltransferase-isomerase [Cyclobacteriaceae bacterium]|jgi:S-adenosylmethionine:tRNA ribosyltransferase-isomerase|nr:S-adenosylmethionine:tRNA ribosyltransferase-isomerase [Cyclobacteriaceae bacterium]